jgi:hypothetical protein
MMWLDTITTRVVGHIACTWKMMDEYNVSVGKPEGKIPPGRPTGG